MSKENYSLTLLGDALFEVLDSNELTVEEVFTKIKETLEESEQYHELRLDRTRDLLRHFAEEFSGETKREWKTVPGLDYFSSENYDMCDGYEWTPLKNEKSDCYWDTDRNR